MLSEIFIDEAFKSYKEDEQYSITAPKQLNFLHKLFKNNEKHTITVGFCNAEKLDFTLSNNTLYLQDELITPDLLINKCDIKDAIKDFCIDNKLPVIDYIADIPNDINYYYRYESKNNGKPFYLYRYLNKLIISGHLLPKIYVRMYESTNFSILIEYITDYYGQYIQNILFTTDLKDECLEYYNLSYDIENKDCWEKVKQKYFTQL